MFPTSLAASPGLPSAAWRICGKASRGWPGREGTECRSRQGWRVSAAHARLPQPRNQVTTDPFKQCQRSAPSPWWPHRWRAPAAAAWWCACRSPVCRRRRRRGCLLVPVGGGGGGGGGRPAGARLSVLQGAKPSLGRSPSMIPACCSSGRRTRGPEQLWAQRTAHVAHGGQHGVLSAGWAVEGQAAGLEEGQTGGTRRRACGHAASVSSRPPAARRPLLSCL